MSVTVAAGTYRELIRGRAQESRRRRSVLSVLAASACTFALGIALVPLVSIVGLTVAKGLAAWSVDFFTHLPTPSGIPGGGIVNALVGSLIIDGVAALMALPVGITVALYLAGSHGRLATAVRFIVDVAAGLPAITIGLFAYAIVVVPQHHFSAFAASVALAVLMLPITIRAGESAIRSVPGDLWEAGIALGIRRARIARSIVMRSALPGLMTAGLLAFSRAVGEAAPLLFTAIGSQVFAASLSQPMASTPLVVYLDGIQPYSDVQQTAWGTALALLVAVFVLGGCARALSRRMRRLEA